MASDVEICNLALSHLGDTANVASIDPPEGSSQADHCARFFRPALNAFLTEHAWNFTSRRASLAQVESAQGGWPYAYALPSDCLEVVAVLMPDEGDMQKGHDYVVESDANGDPLLLTNVPDAWVRYTASQRDASKLPPFAVQALARLLASMLAGPVVKGDAGRAASKDQLGQYAYWLAKAKTADAQQRRIVDQVVDQPAGWMAAR